jgi:hypothetical protein
MWQECKKIVSHYWLSGTIRADVVTWGDQNKDGNIKGIFKVKRTGLTGTKP